MQRRLPSLDMILRRRILLAASLVILVGLGALSCRNYLNKPYRLGWTPDQSKPYGLAFVEFDDRGWLWQESGAGSQAERALALVNSAADKGNTVVVVFVHGWHHNASCCDDNVACFEATLQKLHETLKRQYYQFMREDLDGDKDIKVVGIYIGWRGRSLLGKTDYLTFFGRKSTAIRVGERGLRPFLIALQRIYEANQESKSKFFGLVTVGHSFGGQAVIAALGQGLEEQLQRHQPGQAVRGYGDLIVLVNPAAEATWLRGIDREVQRGGGFPIEQTPALFVVSSEEDKAVRRAFPIGRAIGFFTSPSMSAEQRKVETTAAGVYSCQQTHKLEWIGPETKNCGSNDQFAPSKCLTDGKEPRCCGNRVCSFQGTLDKCEAATEGDTLRRDSYKNRTSVREADFSATPCFGGVCLTRLAGRPVLAYSPVIVATASKEVIGSHTEIFTRRFVTFLTRYIGFVEGKKILQKKPTAVPPQVVNEPMIGEN